MDCSLLQLGFLDFSVCVLFPLAHPPTLIISSSRSIIIFISIIIIIIFIFLFVFVIIIIFIIIVIIGSIIIIIIIVINEFTLEIYMCSTIGGDGTASPL